ncbi:MAG: U32 family peptidase [Actinobacteria bacterium]|nr:U32 family peptidase [Actinomycetota bacterium]
MKKIKINAPAGNLECLKAAVDAGANAVYIGFQSASNLRNFAGINFNFKTAKEGINYAHHHKVKVYVTVNSYPQAGELSICLKAIDDAYKLGADAVIVSDLAVLEYTRKNHPNLPIHLSVQAGASCLESIRFYRDEFGVNYFILPRTLTLKEIKEITASSKAKVELFASGSLCINYEGRCFLSSYITGESTNTEGTCSRPKFLSLEKKEDLIAKINGISINRFSDRELLISPALSARFFADESGQWKDSFLINRRQICKGRFFNKTTRDFDYPFQSPVYLNTLDLIPELSQAGIDAIKIEGRQRSEDYVRRSILVWKKALDDYASNPSGFKVASFLDTELDIMFESLEPSINCYLGK